MSITRWLLVFALLGISACATSPSSLTPVPAPRQEREQTRLVYEAVIRENAQENPLPDGAIVLENHTVSLRILINGLEALAVRRDLPEISEAHWRLFRTRALRREPLIRIPQLPTPVILISEQERAALGAGTETFWDAFARTYPAADTLYGLSHVVFNASFTHALVVVSYGCGPVCGRSYIAFLTWEAGTWHVQRHLHEVVS